MKNYFLLIILLFSINIKSQDTLKKPVVALVLSGGTAKGLAHVGVIKALEEIGIKPDLIVGTSMGSIVGGLYAMGYSAKELEKIVLSTDWYKYLSDDIDLRNLNIDVKDDFDEYTLDLQIEKRKADIGNALVNGHEMELYLNKVTYPSYKYKNFDDFPIRFRAIAADILNTEKYVFKDGPLSIALRSSMSIPTLFTPKKYKDKLFVDGGIIDNFGIDVALENGADIIIGSNVGSVDMNEEQLGSFPKLFWLVMMFESERNYDRFKDSVDVMIESPVLDMATSFDKTKKIVEIGYNTTIEHRNELLQIKKKLDQYQAVEKTIYEIDKFQAYNISNIEVRGFKKHTQTYEIEMFLNKKLGTRVTNNQIKKVIEDLYGSGQYTIITYYLERSNSDAFNLIMEFEEIHNSSIQLGIHYTDQVGFGIVGGITSYNTILPNSKFKIKARISKFPGVKQYFTKYFTENKNLGIKQSFDIMKDRISIYKSNRKITEFNRHFIIPGISLFFAPGKNSLIETGYKFEYSSYEDEFSASFNNVLYADMNTNRFFASYYLNTIDDKFFTSTGNLLKINFSYNEAINLTYKNSESIHNKINDINYFKAKVSFEKYMSLSKKWTLENSIFLEVSDLDIKSPFFLKNRVIGGMFPDNDKQVLFWGANNNSIISNNKAILRTSMKYKLTSNKYIKFLANGALLDDYDYILGAGVLVTMKTPLGPITVGLSSPLNNIDPILQVSMGVF